MNALSWVCRRIWGFAILAAIAGGWFYGWRAGLPLGLLAYGIVYCATFCGATFTVSPHPLSVRPVRRDYTAPEPNEAEQSEQFEELESTPLQQAMERTAYRQRMLEALESHHPLARDEQIAIWCREDLEREASGKSADRG
jgi:hypothetical protein